MGMTHATTLSDGTVLIDGSSVLDPDSIRDLQSDLAEWRQRGHVTVHFAGSPGGGDAAEFLDALGRRTVRLNIGTLVAVGPDARIMHLAAEHEGSWDGESLPVLDAESAYDEFNRLRGDGVVVLVTGSHDGALSALANRLREDA
jgi:UDP-N-acetylmuramoyl-tripeptide--D-alanyl-D-alanine ligase